MTSKDWSNPTLDPDQSKHNLSDSEIELQALFAAMNDFVFVFNRQGQHLKTVPTNPGLLHKLSAEDRHKALPQFAPSVQDQALFNCIQQALDLQQTVHVSYSLPNSLSNGNQEIFFEASVSPMTADSVIWVARDQTERKQAEAELRRSEARFRSYFDLPLVGIAITSPEKGWVAVNDKACQMLGYSREELTQLTWSELTHPEDLVLDMELFGQMLAGEIDQYSMDKRYFCKDGEMIYASLAVGCTRKPDGSVDYVAALMQDVSERTRLEADRKLAEAALRESEQQLREQAEREKLLNRLIRKIRGSLDFDTILSTTLQEIQGFLKVDRCNFAWYDPTADDPAWELIKEVHDPKLRNLAGRCPAALVAPLTQQYLKQEIVCIPDTKMLEDRKLRQFFRFLGCRSVMGIPMQMPSGALGLLSCSHNKTVRHWSNEEMELLQAVMGQLAIALNQAELYAQTHAKAKELEQTLRELQQTQTQMIQSEKMSSLGQLVAGVAHEINNPTNFIYGNLSHAHEYTTDLLQLVQLYQNHYPNPAAEIQQQTKTIDLDFLMQDLPKLLTSMRVGTERIQQIVLSLRNFSRMDESEQKAVDIHEGIDSTLMILQNRLKGKGSKPDITVVKQYGELPPIECYPGQLNQVFMNILANAIDALEEALAEALPLQAARPAPTITIHSEQIISDRVIVKITDNGCGIPEQYRQRLFDPFFTTKAVGKGSGLGLSISYQIVVEKHGGKLSCISVPGQGTEFHIEIPIQQQQRGAGADRDVLLHAQS